MSNELREHLIKERKPTGDFERENRYIVFKRKYLAYLPMQLQHRMKSAVEEALSLLPKLECLVIESDWPEYEPTWAAIEARMTGAAPQPPALGGEVEVVHQYLSKGYFQSWQPLSAEEVDVAKQEGFEVRELIDRAHLDPLQAEIERWKAISAVQKDRMDVALELAKEHREERDQLKADLAERWEQIAELNSEAVQLKARNAELVGAAQGLVCSGYLSVLPDEMQRRFKSCVQAALSDSLRAALSKPDASEQA